MLDWLKRLFRKLTRKTTSQPDFPTERIQLEQAIEACIKDSYRIWEPTTRIFVAQTVALGSRLGLYEVSSKGEILAYAWHVLSESRATWPSLSKGKYGALHLAVSACVRVRTVPNYWAAAVLPSQEMEPKIDQLILELADWCYDVWLPLLWKQWNAITERYGARLESAEFPDSAILRKLLLQEGVCMTLNEAWFAHMHNASLLLEQMITLWSYRNTGKWGC